MEIGGRMKLAVVGSRDFKDYNRMKSILDAKVIDLIISGGAGGADALAKKYAEEENVPYQEFPAKWNDLNHPEALVRTNKWGKQYDAKAGFRRNQDIVDAADALIAFWDGDSNGTNDVITKARVKGIPVETIEFKNEQED
jgi:hypothetical protein